MTLRDMLLGSAALIAIAGCGNGSPKDPSDFMYNPPDGFKQQDKGRGDATLFLGPTEGGVRANLLVRSGKSPESSAEKYGKSKLAQIRKDASVTVKEQESYTIPDSDAYTWLITKPYKSGVLGEQRQFVAIKNGIYVEFSITAAASTFDKYDQALADSLTTFKWGRQN